MYANKEMQNKKLQDNLMQLLGVLKQTIKVAKSRPVVLDCPDVGGN
jgi:hypothetical protein